MKKENPSLSEETRGKGVGKLCRGCDLFLPYSSFHKAPNNKDGRLYICKSCRSLKRKKEYKNNPEKDKQRTKRWREKNPNKHKNSRKTHYLNNKDKYYEYNARRRAAKKRRTPPWVKENHLKELQYIYSLAKEASLLTGEQYDVDHIVPLQGHNVSGLHVPWNLQVLPSDLNYKKGNKYEQKEIKSGRGS